MRARPQADGRARLGVAEARCRDEGQRLPNTSFDGVTRRGTASPSKQAHKSRIAGMEMTDGLR